MTIILYGISNCDSVKRARRWLDDNGLEHAFHDYKKAGIEAERLQAWAKRLGWETLLNRRGTTWRRLDEAERLDLDEERAIALLQANTSLIKRPIVEARDEVLVGFDATLWQRLLLR